MGLKIELNFLGGLDAKRQETLSAIAERWSSVITGGLPTIKLSEDLCTEGLTIDISGGTFPHAHGICGNVGPTHLRPDNLLPARGTMQLDTSDLDCLEARGLLYPALLHQMAHVLGFGILWSSAYLNIVADEGGYDPLFTGPHATEVYSELTRFDQPGIPVENTGGRGNRDFHWRERIFGHELMTGHMDIGPNPLSRLTLAALEDMGYSVDYDAAEAFTLPDPKKCAAKQLDLNRMCRTCKAASYHSQIHILTQKDLFTPKPIPALMT